MVIRQSYDTSVFIEGAIKEVYKTLLIAIGLVVLVIFLFLGSAGDAGARGDGAGFDHCQFHRPAGAFGFSVNLLTLLALVLAIGLVVDDAIVVLENIYRRMAENGETPLVAAFRGTRQVASP
jgi:multidrug efflux pump